MKNYILILLLSAGTFVYGQQVPGKKWMQYASAAEAGFSQTKLDEVKMKHQEFGGAALLVIYDGAIVLSSGDVSRKYMDHSMRKSYVSALFGMHAQTGEIDLNETLDELGIDDLQTLSTDEKKATITDLLSARSGVYHPSAYSPRGMAEKLPARGSHVPGTFWYYNNWDFNTLSTIFKQKTNQDIFEAFDEEIAKPLGLEDFELGDTFFRYEKSSKHPAYLFCLSACDEARFGLLYLNKGKWNKKQLIPKLWVEKSTSAITTELTNFENREGYGYLWWTTKVGEDHGYYASGSGGQRIIVFPSRKMVIVQSTNTYDGSPGIGGQQMDQLVGLIMDSQTEIISSKPKLKPFKIKQKDYPKYAIEPNIVDQYVGSYEHRFLGTMSIELKNDQLILKSNIGHFKLHPVSDNEFIPEDVHFPLIMKKSENAEDKGKIKPQTNPDRSLLSVHFMY